MALADYFKDDALIAQIVKDRAASPPTPASRIVTRDLTGWFDPCRYRPEYFAAYATMILLDNLADATGRMSVSELSRQMPPAIVSVVLGQLRAFGFIDNNVEPGVIRVLKLPGGRERTPSPVSPSLTEPSGALHVSQLSTESPEDSIIERLDAETQEQA